MSGGHVSRNDALASEKLRPILATCLLVVAVAYNGFGIYQLVSDRSDFGGVDLSRRWLDHRYVWQRQNPYDVLATSQGSATAGSRDASIDPAHLSRAERGQAQLSVAALYRVAQVLELRELVNLLAPYVERS